MNVSESAAYSYDTRGIDQSGVEVDPDARRGLVELADPASSSVECE